MTTNEVINELLEKPSYHPPKIGWGGWITVACFTVVLAVIIRTFFIQGFEIPSTSMLPTLKVGDHVLVSKFAFGFRFPFFPERQFAGRDPQIGDVVVFSRTAVEGEPTRYYIKRIAALPGDQVEVRASKTFVNGTEVAPRGRVGELVIQPLAPEMPMPRDTSYVIQDREYFVLGDNRFNSEDSRFFGAITRDSIIGKGFLIYFSLYRANGTSKIRWERIGKGIE